MADFNDFVICIITATENHIVLIKTDPGVLDLWPGNGGIRYRYFVDTDRG